MEGEGVDELDWYFDCFGAVCIELGKFCQCRLRARRVEMLTSEEVVEGNKRIPLHFRPVSVRFCSTTVVTFLYFDQRHSLD